MCAIRIFTYQISAGISVGSVRSGDLRGGAGRLRRGGDAGIRAQVALAKAREVTELCFLSGVNPAFSAERYAEMIGIAHEILPEADIHTMSPDEVTWAATKSGITTAEVIDMARAAGLGTMQGTGGAEILVDAVRSRICPNKTPTAEWVRIIKEAHGMGLKSTATMMYGSLDTADDRAEHLGGVIRDIQDETGGFTEFIPLPFIHENTPLHQAGLVTGGSIGREDLLVFAVSRLFFDNIPHIQISWGARPVTVWPRWVSWLVAMIWAGRCSPMRSQWRPVRRQPTISTRLT